MEDKVANEEDWREPDSKEQRTLSVKEDRAGLVIWYGWTTSAYHSKYYTGRFRILRGDQAGQVQSKDV